AQLQLLQGQAVAVEPAPGLDRVLQVQVHVRGNAVDHPLQGIGPRVGGIVFNGIVTHDCFLSSFSGSVSRLPARMIIAGRGWRRRWMPATNAPASMPDTSPPMWAAVAIQVPANTSISTSITIM